MSCNGCRALRKGCSDDCMLRHCLRGIDNPQAESQATLFVAKFFGRATLMSFLSSVPANQRSALFQSLLYEAVGRTINPVTGAVGLLSTGNWHLCHLAVETVLRSGVLSPLPQFCADAENLQPHDQFRFRPGLVMIGGGRRSQQPKKRWAATPSEESETTTLASSAVDCAAQGGGGGNQRKLLALFF